MKRAFKILGIAAIVVLVLILGAAIALRFALPPEKVRSLVAAQASKSLHREVRIGSAGVRIVPFLGVKLGKLEIANNPDSGFSEEPFVAVEGIDVKLSLKSLLRMSPVVKEIVVDQPALLYEVLADGRTSLDGLGGPKDTTTPPPDSVKPLELPFPLSVERFAIQDGRIRYLDRKGRQEIVLGRIDDETSLRTDAKLENVTTRGRLELREVSVAGEGAAVRKGGIHVTLAHDIGLNLPGAIADIRALELGVQDVKLTLAGRAANFRVVPDLDLALRSNTIQLASLLREIPAEVAPQLAKIVASGAMEIQATAKGKVLPGKLPAIAGTLGLKDIAVSQRGMPAKIEKLEGAIAFTDTSVATKDLSFLVNRNRIDLLVALAGLPKTPILRALDAKGRIDLSALSQIVPSLDTMKLAGILDLNIQGSGPLDPANPTALQLAGTAGLEKVALNAPGLPDRAALDGKATFSNTAIGADLAMRTGPSDLALQANLRDWMALAMPERAQGKVAALQITAKSNVLDIDRFLPPPDTAPKAKDPAKPLSIPKLPPLTVQAEALVGQAKLMGLSIQSFRSTISLKNALLEERATGAVYGGTLLQTLSANLADTSNVAIKTTFEVRDVDANAFISNVNDRLPPKNALYRMVRGLDSAIYGKATISFQGNSAGAPATLAEKLTALVNADFRDGRFTQKLPFLAKLPQAVSGKVPGMNLSDAKEMRFGKAALVMRLEQGALLLDATNFTLPVIGDISGGGKIGLDQSLDLGIDVHLPREASDRLLAAPATSNAMLGSLGLAAQSAVPVDEQKRVILPFKIGGTVSNPTYGVNTPRASDIAKGAAAALLSQQKAELQRRADSLKGAAEAKAQAELDRAKALADQKKREAEEAARKKADEAKGQAKDRAKQEMGKQLKKFGL